MNVTVSDILSASYVSVSLDSLLHVHVSSWVCVASTVCSCESDGHDDGSVAGVEPCAWWENRPFNTHQPITQGMLGAGRPWERPCRGAEGWKWWRGKHTQEGQIKERTGGWR